MGTPTRNTKSGRKATPARKSTTKTANKPLAKKSAAKAKAAIPANITAANTFIAMMTGSGKMTGGTASITAPATLGDAIQAGLEKAGIKFARKEMGEAVRFEREGRKGRPKGRAPRAATVAKFKAAIDAAIAGKRKFKGGVVLVTQADIAAAGLGKCWLSTSDGWKEDKTCSGAATVLGFPVMKADVRSGQEWVVLAPEGADIATAIAAAGKTMKGAAAKGAAAKGTAKRAAKK